jgi:hypothetical protein
MPYLEATSCGEASFLIHSMVLVSFDHSVDQTAVKNM